jgi:hypothetical protein
MCWNPPGPCIAAAAFPHSPCTPAIPTVPFPLASWQKKCFPILEARQEHTVPFEAVGYRTKRLQPVWHRLNMELDLQSLSGLLCTAVLIGYDHLNSPAKVDNISL